MKTALAILALATSLATAAGSAQACGDITVTGNQNQVVCVEYRGGQPAAARLWLHNGSTVKLIAAGKSRQFVYEAPRPVMLAAGARSGTLLFTGERSGEYYSGMAFIFRRGCAQVPYEVLGQVSGDQRSVVLQGQAPILDNYCKVIGFREDVLSFNYLGS